MTRGGALTIACALAGVILWHAPSDRVAASPAQTPTPFHVRTDLVSVYATVTDRAGRLVPDLSRDDFEVRDNGKPQTLTFFSNDVQPITIVLMLDRSGSMESNYALVEDAAEQFLGRLLPDDRARIGNFSREIVILPAEFTNDRGALVTVLHRALQGAGPSPVWTAVDRSITALLSQTGRRVVLLFSDGHDDPMRGQVHTDLKDVMRRSEIDEVMIYAIGLADAESSAPWLVRNRMGQIRVGVGRPKIIKPDKGLRQLAERSGGGYFELTWEQNLGAIFARVADELHHQYALGFVPSKLDGKTHKLEVSIKRSEVSVRARRSYVAEPR